MSLFHDKPPQLSMIAGKLIMSGNFTGVLGGTMTAGTFDANTSGLITWAPPFISAPVIFGSINSGGATTTSPTIRFSGITVSNAYITMGASPLSGVTVGVVVVGETRL